MARQKKKPAICPMGIIIKKRLIDLNMKQIELAEKVGANRKFIWNMIYGLNPGRKYINDIEKILNVKFDIPEKSA